MSKFIGRQVNIGIGKEGTRGTAVSPDFWIPKTDLTFDDKVTTVVDDSSIGVIEDSTGQDVVQTHSEGTISGRIYDTSFGLILLGAFGTEVSQTPVSGDTDAIDHLFNVNESAQHPSLTVSIDEPNAGGGLQYTLGMVETLELAFAVGKYGTYKLGLRANANASGTESATFTAENGFRPQDINVKFASALSGLTAASTIPVMNGTLSINKNLEDDTIIGELAATDRLNKQFSVEGTLELLYDSRTYIDTDMIASLAQAMRVQMINTDVTIGTLSHPSLTLDFAKVKITEVARKLSNNNIVSQSIKFKAFYSISDTSMVSATLRNLQTGAY